MGLPGAQHNNPNVQGQSHFTYDNKNDDKGNATKPKQVSGKTDPVEVITYMIRQLLKDSSPAGNTQDVDLKKIFLRIVSIIVHVIIMVKFSLIQGKITLMISNLQAVAVKSIGILLPAESKSDRSLSSLPPKLPVFSWSSSLSSWQFYC